MAAIKKLTDRIYSDFLMPSRLQEYEVLLKTAMDAGYEICSIREFWRKIKSNQVNADSLYLILRHDIDTDLKTAEEMWRVEKKLGVKSSYYFRLSTLDIRMMKEMEQFGTEASYHYEEVATLAKKFKWKNAKDVNEHLGQISQTFINNLKFIRARSGLPLEIVASHGDFANRKLGIANWILLKDKKVREDSGIELEVYDDSFMKYVNTRHSDGSYPDFWKKNDPLKSIQDRSKVIYILVHPRQWKVRIAVNLRENLVRIMEGIKYGL